MTAGATGRRRGTGRGGADSPSQELALETKCEAKTCTRVEAVGCATCKAREPSASLVTDDSDGVARSLANSTTRRGSATKT